MKYPLNDTRGRKPSHQTWTLVLALRLLPPHRRRARRPVRAPAARAAQGAGAAVVMPLTLTLISEAFPAEKRGMAIGLWGGIAGTGVASGTNSTLRELGGVFGVSVLAAVFTQQGISASPQEFVDRFEPALLVSVGFTAVGVVAALFAPGRAWRDENAALAQPIPALAAQPE